MAIMYLDEDYGEKYLVLTGLIVPVNVWKPLNREINRLKEDFFSTSIFNLKNIRRKEYDKQNFWKKLSEDRKKEFNTKFYQILNSFDILVLSALIDKDKMKDSKNRELHFHLAYSFLMQRYLYYLKERKMLGIVVMDQSKNKEIKYLFFTHRKLLDDGIPTKTKIDKLKVGDKFIEFKDYERQEVKNVFENLIFMDDNYSNCLQISDIICAAISAKFNRNISTYYDKIKSKIRRSSDGKVPGYGIKIFPTNGNTTEL